MHNCPVRLLTRQRKRLSLHTIALTTRPRKEVSCCIGEHKVKWAHKRTDSGRSGRKRNAVMVEDKKGFFSFIHRKASSRYSVGQSQRCTHKKERKKEKRRKKAKKGKKRKTKERQKGKKKKRQPRNSRWQCLTSTHHHHLRRAQVGLQEAPASRPPAEASPSRTCRAS